MDAVPGWAAAVMSRGGTQEELWLMGQPPLDLYLDYAQDNPTADGPIPRCALVDEWRAANDYYYELEVAEAGEADKIEILDLSPELEPLASQVRDDPRCRRSYDTLPTRFAMVELERLVVAQLHVNVTHTSRLKSGLSETPSPEEIFRFCHPINRRGPQIDVTRIGGARYSLTSESSDLRFRESVLLRSDQIDGGERFGSTAVVIGLVIGFSSNFLTAIQSDDRLLLHNGHHRAFALLEHGITHAPCIIQTVTRRDELNLIAGSKEQDAPAFYFKATRPPLLEDFLNPKIGKLHRIPRPRKMIDVSFEVQDHQLAD